MILAGETSIRDVIPFPKTAQGNGPDVRRPVDRAGASTAGAGDRATQAAMITAEQWRERKKQWEFFNRWEAEQPLGDRRPADSIADIGAILDWAPPEVLTEDPDPEKRGIQVLRAAFACLNTRR